jgi:hypothetical protein
LRRDTSANNRRILKTSKSCIDEPSTDNKPTAKPHLHRQCKEQARRDTDGAPTNLAGKSILVK